MNKLLKASAGIALVAASVFLLSGCAAGDTAAAPAESTPAASQSQSAEPTVAATQAATNDKNAPQGSMLTEQQIVATLKPLDFTCNPSELKAVDIVGVEVQFSTISCRRGQEPMVVFNLAADSNELELITIESCKVADGTVLKNPVAAGGNWQVLSAANDRSLLDVLGKTLGGKVSTIKELCTY